MVNTTKFYIFYRKYTIYFDLQGFAMQLLGCSEWLLGDWVTLYNKVSFVNIR